MGQRQPLAGFSHFTQKVPGAARSGLVDLTDIQKLGSGHAEEPGDGDQPAGADAIGALFVFLHLLERQAEMVRQVGLAQLSFQPVAPDILADGPVDRSRSSLHISSLPLWLREPG